MPDNSNTDAQNNQSLEPTISERKHWFETYFDVFEESTGYNNHHYWVEARIPKGLDKATKALTDGTLARMYPDNKLIHQLKVKEKDKHKTPDKYYSTLIFRRSLNALLTYHFDEMVELNQNGMDFYLCVNSLKKDSYRRTNTNVENVRAAFLDCDDVRKITDSFPLPPTMIVETSENKGHFYWVFKEHGDFDQWRAVINGVVNNEGWNPDKAVHDAARLLRIPGFRNNKPEKAIHTRDNSGAPLNIWTGGNGYVSRLIDGDNWNLPDGVIATEELVSWQQVIKKFPMLAHRKNRRFSKVSSGQSDVIDFPPIQFSENYCFLISKLLARTTWESYDEWLYISIVVFTLHFEGHYDIWDSWCATQPSYDKDNNKNLWDYNLELRKSRKWAFRELLRLANTPNVLDVIYWPDVYYDYEQEKTFNPRTKKVEMQEVKKTYIKTTAENCLLLLEIQGIGFYYNTIRKCIDCTEDYGFATKDHKVSDKKGFISKITGAIQRLDPNKLNNWKTLDTFSKAMANNALPEVIDRATRYNPAMPWLISRKWDGKVRSEDFFNTLILDSSYGVSSSYKKMCLRIFLTSIVMAIRPELFSQRHVLVLAGDSAAKKSQWFESLFPEDVREIFFTDSGVLLGDKDDYINLVSHLLVEVGEIDQYLINERGEKTKQAKIKNRITQKKDTIRLPYAERPFTEKRSTVIGGTCNEMKMLDDPTSVDRFMVLPVINCRRVDDNSIDFQQLLAETAHMIDTEQWSPYIDDKELKRLRENNQKYRVTNNVQDALQEAFDWGDIKNKDYWGKKCIMATGKPVFPVTRKGTGAKLHRKYNNSVDEMYRITLPDFKLLMENGELSRSNGPNLTYGIYGERLKTSQIKSRLKLYSSNEITKYLQKLVMLSFKDNNEIIKRMNDGRMGMLSISGQLYWLLPNYLKDFEDF